MPKRYFDLSEDVHIPGRWYLDDPVDERGQGIRTWLFQKGEPAHIEGRIRVPLYKAGRPLDYSELAGTRVPIVHVKVASLLAELAPDDVQLIPVEVESQPDQYCLLNVIRVVRCIDDERSTEVRYWRPEDGRPEKVGHYRSVYRMRIDPTKVGDAKVFRPWGWSAAIILSEDVRDAMERLGIQGAKFKEV